MKSNQKTRVWYTFLWNKYFLFGLVFVIWMTFFDQNSYLLHRELNREIDNLKKDIEYYQENLKQEKAEINYLEHHPEAYEKLAREKYLMKREDETIFLIELKDSIPTK